MGGGNAQKSEIARQRNAARAAANAGGKYVPFLPDRFMLQRNSQLGQKEKAMSIKCKICKQAFMCTQNEQDLLNHISGKVAALFSLAVLSITPVLSSCPFAFLVIFQFVFLAMQHLLDS
eukprot:1773325-Rhodomonas_salina.3